jgi:hypothetical protein
MDSNLHMHVASLQIQDQIRAASAARLANEAKRASRVAAPRRSPRFATHRRFLPTLRRAS